MSNFLYALGRLAQLQGDAVDRLALHEAVQSAEQDSTHQAPQAQLQTVTRLLQIKPARWLHKGDRIRVEIEGLGAIENVVRAEV